MHTFIFVLNHKECFDRYDFITTKTQKMTHHWVHKWQSELSRFNLKGMVAIAVSGGSDSMALAKLMHQTYPLITTITVDHQLRPESRQEAENVNAWMTEWGIPHTILTWQTPSTKRLQERARHARYHLMNQWCQSMHIKTLMTAHHQDDVIETFWMRSSKGSGPTGLCGIAEQRPMPLGRLIRPLLTISHQQLCSFLGHHPFIQDPSNHNTKFERVRCREWLANNPEKKQAALHAIAQFKQTEDYIAQHVQQAMGQYVCNETGNVQTGWEALPTLISQRLWKTLIQRISPKNYPVGYTLGIHIDTTLRNKKAVTAGGVWLKPSRKGVSLQLEPARKVL